MLIFEIAVCERKYINVLGTMQAVILLLVNLLNNDNQSRGMGILYVRCICDLVGCFCGFCFALISPSACSNGDL